MQRLLISALPILIAITFHEVSHGYVAYKLGDPTAKFVGRLTLNPLAHIDPFGTILLPLMLMVLGSPIVFGYAKPVPINPMNFRNPKRGMAISAAAGPITNLILSVISAVAIKFITSPAQAVLPEHIVTTIVYPADQMLRYSIFINVVLASFNLIPIPPLDGGRVLAGLLPDRQALFFSKIERYGLIILIILLATHMADYFVLPLVNFFFGLLQLFVPIPRFF